jgi:hypothetical protein
MATFEDLCAGFCRLAQVPSPALAPDGDGMTAFHVEMHGVGVDVIYVPSKAHALAFLVFELGPMHQQRREAPHIMQALLQSNYLPMMAHAPTFACNPVSGDAVLQCTFPILDGTPEGLATVVEEGVRLAHVWRNDYFLAEQ